MRLTFLSHFVISLAIAAGAVLAWRAGAIQAVWAADQSMMTSAIAALFLATALWLGYQAWRMGKPSFLVNDDYTLVYETPNVSWGVFAERASVMLGLLGTTIGLSLQAKGLATSGTASLGALSTSLYTTGTGIAAALLISVLVYNLEQGAKR